MGRTIIIGSFVLLFLSVAPNILNATEQVSKPEFLAGSEKTFQRVGYQVLNIESDILEEGQKAEFSEFLRNALLDVGVFVTNTGSPEIKDAPDQDSSQKNHTTHEVKTWLVRLQENEYLVYSQIIDPDTQTILKSSSIEYWGSAAEIKPSLEKLAVRLSENGDGQQDQSRLLNQNSFSQSPEWHIAALSVAVLSIWMGNEAAYEYNQLAKDNAVIKTKYQLTSDPAASSSLKSQYDSNADQMKRHENTVSSMQLLTMLALAAEAYMVYDLYNRDREQKDADITETAGSHISFSVADHPDSHGLNLSLSWRF